MRDYRKVPGWLSISGAPWTIANGITGPSIHQGLVWTQAQCDAALLGRVAQITAQLTHDLPWFAKLDPVRQDVMVNIAFNVGVYGEEHWPTTIGHIAAGRYADAANDLRHEGHWNIQVGARADRLAAAMESGVWA